MDDHSSTLRRVDLIEGWHSFRSDRRRVATAVVAVIALGIIGYFAVQPRPGSASPPGASGGPTSSAVAGARPNARGSASRPNSVGSADPSTGTDGVVLNKAAPIVVHVAGAVVHPGVVTVAAGARVVDALDAAGGTIAEAEPNQLDLAAKLVDGTRIYVPRRGEHATNLQPNVGPGPDPSQPAGPVSLNSATQTELEALPGVGPSLAQAILAERLRLGGFTSVNDLKRVHGIGARRFDQLKALVAL